MSTSRDSLIGLPPFSDSSTENSRARSARMRAIRNMYFERSPGDVLHHGRDASRAACTASATSSSPACAILASGSSSRGEIVTKVSPDFAGTNSPPMKRPYSSSRRTMSRDSGAGAYVQPAGTGARSCRRSTSPTVHHLVERLRVEVLEELAHPAQMPVVDLGRAEGGDCVAARPGREADEHRRPVVVAQQRRRDAGLDLRADVIDERTPRRDELVLAPGLHGP